MDQPLKISAWYKNRAEFRIKTIIKADGTKVINVQRRKDFSYHFFRWVFLSIVLIPLAAVFYYEWNECRDPESDSYNPEYDFKTIEYAKQCIDNRLKDIRKEEQEQAWLRLKDKVKKVIYQKYP